MRNEYFFTIPEEYEALVGSTARIGKILIDDEELKVEFCMKYWKSVFFGPTTLTSDQIKHMVVVTEEDALESAPKIAKGGIYI